MSDTAPAAPSRPVRVLHLVSGGTETNPVLAGMLLPLLVRGDRRSVTSRVVHFAPGHPHAAVVRQSGIPVHELKLSRRRSSLLAPRELVEITRDFAPDIVHAWGLTAHIAAALLAKVAKARPQLIFSYLTTDPLTAKGAGLDRLKLDLALRAARMATRRVFPADIARSRHVRAGFPEAECAVIAPGVDADRYKPDFATRKRIRDQLGLPADAFVIGMQAPFQTEFDHLTFFKAVGDLVRANPHTQVLLAGRGVQKGNAPLMALVGGGTLATHVRLLGEWSDSAGLFNACDVVCSTALTDELRMTLAMAMLCGVPCVATGLGAQSEVVGEFGIGVEPGSQSSLTRGLTRVMEMPVERRAFMAKGARQHALTRFNQARSIRDYYGLYGVQPAAPPAAVPARTETPPAAARSVDQLSAA